MGDDEPESDEEDLDDTEKPIYNPKKVPLDWTGKPIPYWLYKLHGLNVEYKCEICGNFSYWGPRAFERHFQVRVCVRARVRVRRPVRVRTRAAERLGSAFPGLANCNET